MEEEKHLIILARDFWVATEELKQRHIELKRYTWQDRGYKDAFAKVREQEYAVSTLYKAISTEKTKLWRIAKQ